MKHLRFVVHSASIKLERFVTSIDYNRNWANFCYSKLKSNLTSSFNVNVTY